MRNSEPGGDLEGILHPLDSATFFRKFWEREPCVVTRGNPKYHSNLASVADVDSIICLSSPSMADRSSIRVVKSEGGNVLSKEIPYTSDGIPNIYFLYEAFHDGYTIIMNRVHARLKAVALLCGGMEAAFHCPVGANLYFTPRRAQGFLPHFDTHDVFILQLEGEKTWRLYDTFVPLPLETSKQSITRDELGPPRQEVQLPAGDLLYIPRGHVHEALTSEVSSLHLTVGIYVLRWSDLLKESLLLAAEEDVRFRESVPTILLRPGTADEAIESRLRQLVSILAEKANARKAIDLLSEGYFGKHPVPDGHFVSVDRIPDIHIDSVVKRRTGMACSVVRKEGAADIRFRGNVVSGPPAIEPALHFIAGSERFTVRDLPDCLTDSGKCVLTRRLVREGLLAVIQT